MHWRQRLLREPAADDSNLLDVDEVASYLGVGRVTIYRWCREGRLPCLKLGKAWRIREGALEEFLRRREQRTTLVGQLGAFLRASDSVIGVVQSRKLLHRLDAAFFRVGEVRESAMVKFHGGEAANEDTIRRSFERNGFEAGRLESEGRFRFFDESRSGKGRVELLKEFATRAAEEGKELWAAFDWAEDAELEDALQQQNEITGLSSRGRMTVMTSVLDETLNGWQMDVQRRAQEVHSGIVWVSESGVMLSRFTPLSSDS